MNLAALDLNLLVALEALLQEASVSRAAARLALSQPAVSHALRRLRELLGDPLLVRVGLGMELTPRAESLREPLQEALEKVRALLSEEAFNPATSRRRFTLMMPDLVTSLLMPELVRRLEKEAPHVRLDLTPWRGPSMMSPELARTLDAVISYQAHDFAGFHRQRLYSDTDVLAVRRGHPMGRRLGRLDVFLAARHVAVIGRGEQADPIDTWLEAQGLTRNVVLSTPTYLQALQVAARSDLVAFVPSRLVSAMAGALDLAAVRPPVDPGLDEQLLFYPARLQVDPASVWLRSALLALGRALDVSPASAPARPPPRRTGRAGAPPRP